MPAPITDIRTKLIQCGRVMFNENGFTGFSMRRLAAECGVAVGTIYNYYKDKDALLSAILSEDWDNILDRMSAAAISSNSFPEGILTLFHIYCEFIEKYSGIWLILSEGPSSIDKAHLRHIRSREEIGGVVALLMDNQKQSELKPLLPLISEVILAAAHDSALTEDMIYDMMTRLSAC